MRIQRFGKLWKACSYALVFVLGVFLGSLLVAEVERPNALRPRFYGRLHPVEDLGCDTAELRLWLHASFENMKFAYKWDPRIQETLCRFQYGEEE